MPFIGWTRSRTYSAETLGTNAGSLRGKTGAWAPENGQGNPKRKTKMREPGNGWINNSCKLPPPQSQPTSASSAENRGLTNNWDSGATAWPFLKLPTEAERSPEVQGQREPGHHSANVPRDRPLHPRLLPSIY